jgi:hypothetical protein
MVKRSTFGTTMQILHKEKLKPLGYEQHTYAIMGTTKKIVRKNTLTCFHQQ